MRHRSFAARFVAVIVVAGLAPVWFWSSARASRKHAPAQARASAKYVPPHTPDGRPDLQGTWQNNDATPLERPKELEGKASLTEQELSELKKHAARLFA